MKLKTLLLASAILMPLTPALADHPGPTGIDGGGATISLLSPDTLESNGWSAGTRLSFTRPDQRPDEELARLAGKHIHAHNADYVLNSAVGVAYGITDQLTVSAELPYVRRDDLRAGEHSHSGSMSTMKLSNSTTYRELAMRVSSPNTRSSIEMDYGLPWWAD